MAQRKWYVRDRHNAEPNSARLAREEVRSLLAAMKGTPRLVAAILCGGGLRLLEALRLRVIDVDFAARLLVVREGGEGPSHDAPDSLQQALHAQIDWVRRIHRKDLAAGRVMSGCPRRGRPSIPGAIERRLQLDAAHVRLQSFSKQSTLQRYTLPSTQEEL